MVFDDERMDGGLADDVARWGPNDQGREVASRLERAHRDGLCGRRAWESLPFDREPIGPRSSIVTRRERAEPPSVRAIGFHTIEAAAAEGAIPSRFDDDDRL